MSRSLRKGPFCSTSLVSYEGTAKNSIQKVWSRGSTVLPQHVGKQFNVHNGKNWILIRVMEDMVGHKFGEFSSTRKKTIHKFQKRKQTTRKKLA